MLLVGATGTLGSRIDGQVALARAAKATGVRRFIPSDFALDIWAAPEGAPMFALRREADDMIDGLGLEVLHVLNGAFMNMMLDPRTAGVVDQAGPGSAPENHPALLPSRFAEPVHSRFAEPGLIT